MSESSRIEAIRAKIELLIADNKRLRAQNNRLESQLDKLKLNSIGLAEQKIELERRVEILELKDGFMGEGDGVSLARTRVNKLIREVDKCIALLQ